MLSSAREDRFRDDAEATIYGAWWGERFRRRKTLRGLHLKEAIDSLYPPAPVDPRERVAAMLQVAERVTAQMKAQAKAAGRKE